MDHNLFSKRYILKGYTYNICKTQIDIQSLIDAQSLNLCQISTSQTSAPQIYALFFKFSNWPPIFKSMFFFKFSNRRPILKSLVVFHFLKSTSNDVIMSLDYTLILTLANTSAIDLIIWKGCRFENTLKSNRDLR